MKSKMISIRLNLEKLTDNKTNEILISLPSRRKSEYIRNSIIAYNNQEKLLELLKQVVLEVLEEKDAKQAGKKSKNNGGYDDFLRSIK